MEVPLLLWRGQTTSDCSSTITQHTSTPLRQLWCLWLHTFPNTDRNLQLICTGQKALLPPTKPPQCRNHSQVFQIPAKGAEKPRGVLAGWVTLPKPTAPSRLCPHRLVVNKASLSRVSFWVVFFFGMRLQNTFLWGHLSTAQHIFSIPWSGSQDNIKPVNCSNCHKGRAVAVVKSFVGDAHHTDHLLLDSSSWSHQTFNHLRECMFQGKLLRNLPANLHKLINACTFSKLLTH